MSIISNERNTKTAITSAEYKAFDEIIARARQERKEAEAPVINAFKQMYKDFKGDGQWHTARQIRSHMLSNYGLDLSVYEIAGNLYAMRYDSRYHISIKTDVQPTHTTYALVRPDGTVDMNCTKQFEGCLGYRFF